MQLHLFFRDKGEFSAYRKHKAWDRRAQIFKPEKGTMLAHERRHAKGFFMHVQSVVSVLEPYIGKRWVLNSTINQSLDKVTKDSSAFVSDFIDSANRATVDYFATHGFKFLGSTKEYEYVWSKK